MNQPSTFSQLLRRMAVVTLTAIGLILPAACSSEDAKCEGVDINGKCQATCDPATCAVPGSICLENYCSAPCQGHEFCPVGQNCGFVSGLTNAPDGNYCYVPPFAIGGKTGQFEECTTNDTCDQARGFTCINAVCAPTCKNHSDCTAYKAYCKKDETNGLNGCVKGEAQPPGQGGPCSSSFECDQPGGYQCAEKECRLTRCRTHTDCAAIGLCKNTTLETGEKTTACFPDTVHPDGQYGTRCIDGSSAGECDEANGFVCIGAGPGDVDAYCTGTACQAGGCPTGYFCSTVRTGRDPCEATCTGVDPAPTDPNCVKPADIGAGKEYSCGPISLLRNLCLKNEYCNECKTDEDCRGLPDQICAKDSKGKKRCTTLCDPSVSGACPWGTASLCSITDTDLNVPTCSHRFGACEATGKSCEPCIDDADCPTGLCASSDFTQERYCADLSITCDCTGLPTVQNQYCLGGGCPQTPGGLNMRCFGGSAVPATSLLLNKCFGASITQQFGGSPQTACWPK